MKFLLHMYPGPEPVVCVVNGRKHELEMGVPYDVAEHLPATEGTGLGTYRAPDEKPVNVDFYAQAIHHQLRWAGVVEVPLAKTAYGMGLNEEVVSAAKRSASEELLRADSQTFETYRKIQEDRGKEGRPALVPVGLYASVIKRRNIDLAKYGIRPVGAEIVQEQAHQGMEVAQLREQVVAQQEQINRLINFLQPRPLPLPDDDSEIPASSSPRSRKAKA
jgi:hypothetical protein